MLGRVRSLYLTVIGFQTEVNSSKPIGILVLDSRAYTNKQYYSTSWGLVAGGSNEILTLVSYHSHLKWLVDSVHLSKVHFLIYLGPNPP